MSAIITSHAENAAQYITQRVPVAHSEECIGSVMTRLAENTLDSAEVIYVVDTYYHLCGLVRLPDLLTMPTNCKLGDIMMAHPPTAYPEEDQEEVAGLAVRHGLAAVPIVNHEQVFLGIVPAQALIRILRREHIEDLHRLAGIQRENHYARQAMEAPPIRRAQDRLPWLLVGLGGSILATFVVSRFEQVLEEKVFVSFFVPGIVYLADAIGTQTEAIAVRGLSLSHVPLQNSLLGELRTGFLIGLALGGISLPLVLIMFGNLRLALAVALSILMAGSGASTMGLLLPWILDKAGKDPAFGSGPVATIIQDVLSLLIYFAIIQILQV